jgi:hypothetical protein
MYLLDHEQVGGHTIADVQVNELGPEMSLLSGLDDFWLVVSYYSTIPVNHD